MMRTSDGRRPDGIGRRARAIDATTARVASVATRARFPSLRARWRCATTRSRSRAGVRTRPRVCATREAPSSKSGTSVNGTIRESKLITSVRRAHRGRSRSSARSAAAAPMSPSTPREAALEVFAASRGPLSKAVGDAKSTELPLRGGASRRPSSSPILRDIGTRSIVASPLPAAARPALPLPPPSPALPLPPTSALPPRPAIFLQSTSTATTSESSRGGSSARARPSARSSRGSASTPRATRRRDPTASRRRTRTTRSTSASSASWTTTSTRWTASWTSTRARETSWAARARRAAATRRPRASARDDATAAAAGEGGIEGDWDFPTTPPRGGRRTTSTSRQTTPTDLSRRRALTATRTRARTFQRPGCIRYARRWTA